MVNASDFIEALDSIAPGLWRQLTNTELKNQGYADYLLGWRIELGSSEIAASDVNHLVILIDNRFPFSQIRVVAPQLGSNFIWPHVEEKGFLCLRPTLTTANIEKRIEQHFKDAINVLSLTKEEVKKEFAREFIAYWGQRSTKSQRELSILSLVCPSYQGKELFYFYILSMKAYVVSESKEKLGCWLKNLNVSFEYEKLNQRKR